MVGREGAGEDGGRRNGKLCAAGCAQLLGDRLAGKEDGPDGRHVWCLWLLVVKFVGSCIHFRSKMDRATGIVMTTKIRIPDLGANVRWA